MKRPCHKISLKYKTLQAFKDDMCQLFLYDYIFVTISHMVNNGPIRPTIRLPNDPCMAQRGQNGLGVWNKTVQKHCFFVQKHCFFCPKTLPFLVQNTVFFYPKHFHSIRIFLSRSTSTHLLKLSAEGTDPQPPSGLPLRNQTHFLGNSGYYQARWQPAPLLTVSLTEEHSFLNFPSSKWLVNANVCVQENELFEQYFIDKYKGGQPTLQDDRLIYHLRPNSI